jgi:hypothetical protein
VTEVEPVSEEDDVLDGVLDGCCSVVVVVVVVGVPVVLPWVVSAATTENVPARAIAAAIIQRLIRETSLRPRSRESLRGGVMAPRIGAGCKRPLSER